MHSITFSQLRVAKCLDQLEAWLEAGETVELLYRRRIVAHFVPTKTWPLPEEEDVHESREDLSRRRIEKPTAE